MSSYLIDRTPDDRLPSLTPRLIGEHTVLVTLADCTPFLSIRPFSRDELWSVLVRLLMVPGGPLVARDGTPCGTILVDLPWCVADKPPDALTLADIGMWAEFADTAKPDDLDHVRHLALVEVLYRLSLAKKLPWWPYAKSLLERAVWRNCGDTMLAGLPEP